MLPIVRDRASVVVLNIDERQEWQREFGERIPVVEVGGRVICQYHLDVEALSLALSEAAS